LNKSTSHDGKDAEKMLVSPKIGCLAASLAAAGLCLAAVPAKAVTDGWQPVHPHYYHCAKPVMGYPITFRCSLAHAHSVHARIPTSGGQQLKWKLRCNSYPDLVIRDSITSRRNYFFWIDQNHHFTAFDIMSFESCHLLVRLWLMPGAVLGKWKITFTNTYSY
jgi:hypothetical protein